MVFRNEADFEEAVIKVLKQHGWEDTVIYQPDEKDLIQNWADILLANNSDIDRLNGIPLTEGEMDQILDQVKALRSPQALNGFINGRTISIKRDNPLDAAHLGKEISLKIYDRDEIAGGTSRYQIVQQPRFHARNPIYNDRRGDIMLLINGMPVIHIELKRTGVNPRQAIHQINNYLHEGVFTGIFSLVQIFVAMNPEDAFYFANPGTGRRVNESFIFRWADFNNIPVTNWKEVTHQLLHIPMAHQLVGYYTVADSSDDTLKVMRSYQICAADQIANRVAKAKWDQQGPGSQLGGYIWHTTGSGKTMTSFKSAQLIANSKSADKVVFLMDRIELGTQSLQEYQSFADALDDVQGTEDTAALLGKLKSKDPSDTLIVTSIQKMSNLHLGKALRPADHRMLQEKRIVFIIDECHRSTFGEMLTVIKETFPRAMFFGFTGTPIHDENQKKSATTTSIFGDELHRYSIADGIRDKNVLPFDKYETQTFPDVELKKALALHEAMASTYTEVLEDPQKQAKYDQITSMEMAGHFDESGKWIKGIEDLMRSRGIRQYQQEKHYRAVAGNIIQNFEIHSKGGFFHAILATQSIPEAIEYFRLFKQMATEPGWRNYRPLRVTALFDPNIDNTEGAIDKGEGLAEIIEDYNAMFGKDFTMKTHAAMKRDMAARMAHKGPYVDLEQDSRRGERIDLLIVVNQMLTGFDSKFVNTLYLDKLIQYEEIIQAFSRTNRVWKWDQKPHGIIHYYRWPHTMRQNIEKAVKLYSGDRPFGLWVEKIDENVAKMQAAFNNICKIFAAAGVVDFSELPEEPEAKAQFAKEFATLQRHLDSGRLQGFSWDRAEKADGLDEDLSWAGELTFGEHEYNTLVTRYKELAELAEKRSKEPMTGNEVDPLVALPIETHVTQIDTGKIDNDYMNANFTRWYKALQQENISQEEMDLLLGELHRSFASLPQERQKFAHQFLSDVRAGDVELEPGKTCFDYINDYEAAAEDRRITDFSDAFGLDSDRLRELLELRTTSHNIDEYGRLDRLFETLDKAKAKLFFQTHGVQVPAFKVMMKSKTLIRQFILEGGFDLDEDTDLLQLVGE